MRKIWINRAKSFEEAQDFDNVYYLNLSSVERVEIVQILREEYFKSHGLKSREDKKDYEEFLELLNKHDVRYCIIGAFALAFHARPQLKAWNLLISGRVESRDLTVSRRSILLIAKI